jgi:hypothetical protein
MLTKRERMEIEVAKKLEEWTEGIEYYPCKLLCRQMFRVALKVNRLEYNHADFFVEYMYPFIKERIVEKVKTLKGIKDVAKQNREIKDWYWYQVYALEDLHFVKYPGNLIQLSPYVLEDLQECLRVASKPPELPKIFDWDEEWKNICSQSSLLHKIYGDEKVNVNKLEKVSCLLPEYKYNPTPLELEEEFLNQPLSCLQFFKWFEDNKSEHLLYQLWLKNGGQISFNNVKNNFSSTLHSYFSRRYFTDLRNTPTYKKQLEEEILHDIKVIAQDRSLNSNNSFTSPDFGKVFGKKYNLY